MKETNMRTAIIAVTGVLAGSLGVAARANPPPDATTFQMTIDHAGVTSSGGAVALQASPLWTVPLPGPSSYPLISNGIVYVTIGKSTSGPNGSQLLALDAKTGNTVWGPVAIAGTYQWSNASIDGGKLFVVNFDGVLRSFDATTGALGFSVQLPGQYAFSSPPNASGGVVYTGGAGSGGTVYAADETAGAVLWSMGVANGDNSSPALSGSGVYVSYVCPQVYDFDPDTGAQLWHYNPNCDGGGGTTPVYSGGRLYVRDTNGSGYVFDATSGAVLYQFSASTIPAVTSTAAYYLNNNGVLEAHDPASGKLLWSFQGDGKLSSAPIVVDQYLIEGSSSGALFALEAGSGRVVWQGSAGAPISGPDENGVAQPLSGLAIADGVLVVPAGNSLVAYSLLGPAPPGAVTATAGVDQVSLTWTASAGATSYQVFVGTQAGGEATQAAMTGVTGTSATVTGLASGATYFFTVRAVTGKLLSFASTEASASPSALQAPTSVKAAAGDGSISLSWTAAAGAGSYSVFMGTTAGAEAATAVSTGVVGNSTRITGLTNGTKYYFVVKSVAASFTSSASNEASGTPVAPAPVDVEGGGGGGGGSTGLAEIACLLALLALRRRRSEAPV
jgi:outer membrane protein assembly factor BamB